MTKPMTYAEVRDTVASWSIEGKRLPIVEFIDSQQQENERLRKALAEATTHHDILHPTNLANVQGWHYTDPACPIHGHD